MEAGLEFAGVQLAAWLQRWLRLETDWFEAGAQVRRREAEE